MPKKKEGYMAEPTDPIGGYEKHCPMCGSEFYAHSEWVYQTRYKGKMSYFCRYNCWIKAQKEEGRQI